MKPNLKLQSSFFSSPYRSNTPGQLSPLPHESLSGSSSASESQHDPSTPLLPPTPSMAEKGRDNYPFPSEQRGLARRLKLALGGSRAPAMKRVLFVILVIGMLVLVGRQTGQVSVPSNLD